MSAKNSHGIAFALVTISVLLLTLTYVTNAKSQLMAPSTATMESASPAAPMTAPSMAPEPAMVATVAPAMTAPLPVMTVEPVMAAPPPAMTTAPVVPPMVVAPPMAAVPPRAEGYLDDEFKTRKPVAEEVTKPAATPKSELVVQPVTSTVAASPVATVAPKVSAAEKKDTWWQTLLGGLLQLVLLFAAAVLTPLGVLLVKYVAKKAKIADAQVQEALNGLYDCAVDTGITFATQMANKLNNNPDAKAQRIKWATSKALELVKEWKLPEKTSKWVEDAIEARLGWANGTKPVEEEQPLKEAVPTEPTPTALGVSASPLDLNKKE